MDKNTFYENEYLYLTGQWFTPLPAHYWNLMAFAMVGGIIVEVETDIEFQLTGDAKIKGYCEGFGKDGLIFRIGSIGKVTVLPGNIKRMRISSFEFPGLDKNR